MTFTADGRLNARHRSPSDLPPPSVQAARCQQHPRRVRNHYLRRRVGEGRLSACAVPTKMPARTSVEALRTGIEQNNTVVMPAWVSGDAKPGWPTAAQQRRPPPQPIKCRTDSSPQTAVPALFRSAPPLHVHVVAPVDHDLREVRKGTFLGNTDLPRSSSARVEGEGRSGSSTSAWNEPERGGTSPRSSRRSSRRRGARVLPARPVISVRSSGWDQPRSGLAGEPSP